MIYIILILAIMFGPPVFFTVLGCNQSDKKKAKIYYIIAVVYLIVGLGICASIITGL